MNQTITVYQGKTAGRDAAVLSWERTRQKR